MGCSNSKARNDRAARSGGVVLPKCAANISKKANAELCAAPTFAIPTFANIEAVFGSPIRHRPNINKSEHVTTSTSTNPNHSEEEMRTVKKGDTASKKKIDIFTNNSSTPSALFATDQALCDKSYNCAIEIDFGDENEDLPKSKKESPSTASGSLLRSPRAARARPPTAGRDASPNNNTGVRNDDDDAFGQFIACDTDTEDCEEEDVINGRNRCITKQRKEEEEEEESVFSSSSSAGISRVGSTLDQSSSTTTTTTPSSACPHLHAKTLIDSLLEGKEGAPTCRLLGRAPFGTDDEDSEHGYHRNIVRCSNKNAPFGNDEDEFDKNGRGKEQPAFGSLQANRTENNTCACSRRCPSHGNLDDYDDDDIIISQTRFTQPYIDAFGPCSADCACNRDSDEDTDAASTTKTSHEPNAPFGNAVIDENAPYARTYSAMVPPLKSALKKKKVEVYSPSTFKAYPSPSSSSRRNTPLRTTTPVRTHNGAASALRPVSPSRTQHALSTANAAAGGNTTSPQRNKSRPTTPNLKAASARRVAFDADTCTTPRTVFVQTVRPVPKGFLSSAPRLACLTQKQQQIFCNAHEHANTNTSAAEHKKGSLAARLSRCAERSRPGDFADMAHSFEQLLTNINAIDEHLK